MNSKKKAAVVSGGEKSNHNGSYPRTIAQSIYACIEGGLSVIPIDHTSKRPAMAFLPKGEDGKPTWAPFRDEIANDEWCKYWDDSGVHAVAVVCGKVSGGLLCIDFDVPSIFPAWQQKVGDLANGLPVQRTGGGGYQVFLRCQNPGGNQKLAWAADEAEQSGRTIAIETRGEGGYAVVPPSLHPGGKRYEMISGNLSNVPTISQEQADALLAAARELDERRYTLQQMEKMASEACAFHHQNRKKQTGRGIIGAFNQAHPIEAVLEEHGYIRSGDRYIRPCGNSASVSILDGRSCHWSSNDPLNDGKVHDGMGVHDAFSIFCQLDHGGDVSAAVKAAANDLGMDIPAAATGEELSVAVGGGTVIPLILSYQLGSKAKWQFTVRRNDALVHEDGIDLASATSRTRFARSLAKKLIPADVEDGKAAHESATSAVENALLAKLAEVRAASQPDDDGDDQPNHQMLLDELPKNVRDQAEAMLDDPNLLRRISDDMTLIGIAGERMLAMIIFLVGVSRLLLKPLAAIISGHTSTGKSFIAETISRLFPPESLILANRITPQALFHMRPGSLKHRWVVGGERSRVENDEAAEATRALREILASGKLAKLMPIKVGNNIETHPIEQEGPIAFTESTTLTRVFDEDSNRCLQVSSDEREEQTRRILRAHAASRSVSPAMLDHLRLCHHAFQRMLAVYSADHRVVIPYAAELGEQFPARRPEARRSFGHLLSMIEAVALLYHRQRDHDDDGAIIASEDDYRIVRFLLGGPMNRSLGQAISDGARRFWDRLRRWAPVSECFTSSAVYPNEQYSERHVRGWLAELAHAGWLEVVEAGGRGKAWSYRFAHVVPVDEENQEVEDVDASVLPAVEAVVKSMTRKPTSTQESTVMNVQELKLIFDNDRKPDAWPAATDAVTGDSEFDEFYDPAANSLIAGDGAGNDTFGAGSTDEDEDDALDGEAPVEDLPEGAANADYDEFEVATPDLTQIIHAPA